MARHYGSILTMPKKALAQRFCRKARKGTKVKKAACVRAAMKMPTSELLKVVLTGRSERAQGKRPYSRTASGWRKGGPLLPSWL